MRKYLCKQKGGTVSVIIPMYNVEKYIGECLDSLLLQTLQDFEVIVVDDCSTDNSVKIVEEYAPKFNGRLKLSKTETNSGCPAIPRNIGLNLSTGDYVYFLDADDFILPNALETFYNLARDYNADVVYTSDYYALEAPNDIYRETDNEGKNLLEQGLENKTELIIADTDKIFEKVCRTRYDVVPWSRFVRREILIKNEVFFPEIPLHEDVIWTLNLCKYANRFLRITTPLYFYRYNEESRTKTVYDVKEQVSYRFSGFVAYAKALYELVNKTPFLKENPDLVRAKLQGTFNYVITRFAMAEDNLSDKEIYEVFHAAFMKEKDFFYMTIPFFLNSIIANQMYTKELMKRIQRAKNDGLLDNSELSCLEPASTAAFLLKALSDMSTMYNDNLKIPDEFCNYFTGRIDVKFVSTMGSFEILFISDDKATIEKPSWLQKRGSGYQIQSYKGKLELIVKTTIKGEIKLWLKGIDVRAPEDKSKRVPYWVDYTKLVINDKIIFDALTPVWHDKPYEYNFPVKANAKIKIQLEWLPHRSDI